MDTEMTFESGAHIQGRREKLFVPQAVVPTIHSFDFTRTSNTAQSAPQTLDFPSHLIIGLHVNDASPVSTLANLTRYDWLPDRRGHVTGVREPKRARATRFPG